MSGGKDKKKTIEKKKANGVEGPSLKKKTIQSSYEGEWKDARMLGLYLEKL